MVHLLFTVGSPHKQKYTLFWKTGLNILPLRQVFLTPWKYQGLVLVCKAKHKDELIKNNANILIIKIQSRTQHFGWGLLWAVKREISNLGLISPVPAERLLAKTSPWPCFLFPVWIVILFCLVLLYDWFAMPLALIEQWDNFSCYLTRLVYEGWFSFPLHSWFTCFPF